MWLCKLSACVLNILENLNSATQLESVYIYIKSIITVDGVAVSQKNAYHVTFHVKITVEIRNLGAKAKI